MIRLAPHGFPLAGARVRLLPARGAGRTEPIAQGTTDRHGRFRLLATATPAPTGTVRAVAGSRARRGTPRILARVDAETAGGLVLSPREPVLLEHQRPLTLTLPVGDRNVAPGSWRTAAQRLAAARMAQVNLVVEALLDASPSALLGDLDLAERHAMAAALEAAFLDPEGRLAAHLPARFAALADFDALATLRRKLETAGDAQDLAALGAAAAKAGVFSSIQDVDWVIDLDELGQAGSQAGPAKAMKKYQTGYQYSDSNFDHAVLGFDPEIIAVLHPPTDLSRYRDYLLAIWTGPLDGPEFAARRQKLRDRFHQSFAGNDVTAQPANRLLHGIVREILTAAPGPTFGFGVAASSIPAQGASSDREHLETLVALSGLSMAEFSRRYHLDLSRGDDQTTSVVAEQVRALQRLYTDTFEAPAEPDGIIHKDLLGKGPFFLFYTEWLRATGAFHPENLLEIHRTIGTQMPPERRASLLEQDWEQIDDDEPEKWLIPLLHAEDAVAEAVRRMGQLQPDLAADQLALAEKWTLRGVTRLPGGTSVDAALADFGAWLDHLAGLPATSAHEVDEFARWLRPIPFGGDDPTTYTSEYSEWLDDFGDRLRLSLCHLHLLVLPTLRGDLALSIGDYAAAVAAYEVTTRFLLARSHESQSTGWDDAIFGTHVDVPSAEKDWGGPGFARLRDADGTLPYTAYTGPGDALRIEVPETDWGGWLIFQRDLRKALLKRHHPMLRRMFALRHAEAMLQWADALYRTEEPSAVARAREVYKAVLLLHEAATGVFPHWPQESTFPHFHFRPHSPNPAKISQVARARAGVEQIEAGLNVLGLSDAVVPSLRYRTLKDAADRFAAAARAAQQDFLAYLGKVEASIREEIVHANMLRRAALQERLAAEQATIAGVAVKFAEDQVAQVKAAIEAKKAEIEEHEDFFNQFTSFVGGMVTAITDLPSSMTGKVGEGAAVAGGLSAAEGATLSGAAAGGLALAGYGLFVYAGYTSLSGIAEQGNSLHEQLKALQTRALPLAQEQLRAREAERRIALLQGQIAQADAAFARELMHFEATRFLNAELWSRLAMVVRRLLQRFLALGARFAWLAERALAFEQNRPLDIIRLDYFPRKLQGLTGADLLQADLAELYAAWLEGLKQMLPIRRTVSLAFDFPAQFAQLRATGRCDFFTSELPLRLEHPGAYGIRVVAVEVGFGSGAPLPPLRGLLINLGVSAVSQEDGSKIVLIRESEAMPLSEFRLRRDSRVHGIPGDMLMPFEGTGFESAWRLMLPPAANLSGLDELADVQITFDLRASHSPVLQAAHEAGAPTTIRRFVFLSMAAHAADGLADLQNAQGQAVMAVTVGSGIVPAWHSGATVRNVTVFVVATPAPNLSLTVQAGGGPAVSVVLANGMALSNAPPLNENPPQPPAPLNALLGAALPQTFTITVDTAQKGAFDLAGIKDVVLGVEYEASLPTS